MAGHAPFGVQTINQRMRTLNPGTDYLTNYSDWLDAQNGRTKGAYVTFQMKYRIEWYE